MGFFLNGFAIGMVNCLTEGTYHFVIQFPPEMDENWVRYGLAKLGQISRTKLAEDAVLCVHNTASALNR